MVAVNYHASWVAAVFRSWAHRDLETAAAKAVTLSGDAKALATKAILELDLPASLRESLADELDDGTMYWALPALGEISARQAAMGGPRGFVGAWEDALKTTDLRVRGLRIPQLARAWAREDWTAALEAASGVKNQRLMHNAQAAVMGTLAAEDHRAAIDLSPTTRAC